MGFSSAIRIGSEFFAKAFADYADKWWSLIREFWQNGADCGSNQIAFEIEEGDDHTVLTVSNDGEPMSREILTGKLLSLGSSGKDFVGTVGGFGRGKELLYWVHRSYSIRTGEFLVEGSGAGYNLAEGQPPLHGTTSRIVIEGRVRQDLMRATRLFASFAQWKGTVLLDGERLSADLQKGAFRRELGFARVYSNRTHPNRLVVRIGGIPMFHERIDLDRCIVVELTGTSGERLTSNRDGLRAPYRWQLTDFITELSVDKRSALKARQATYRHYAGHKIEHVVQAVNLAELIGGAWNDAEAMEPPAGKPDLAADAIYLAAGRGVEAAAKAEISAVSLGTEFLIKNDCGMEIPRYFLPEGGEFSGYSRKLVRMWGLVLLELHRLLKQSASFAIGFIFSEDAEAEHERGDYGQCYFINPAVVVKQQGTGSRSFRKRFRLNERHRILAIAVHEFVHGAYGLQRHDEDFAARQTLVTGVVMANLRRFNRCFRFH